MYDKYINLVFRICHNIVITIVSLLLEHLLQISESRTLVTKNQMTYWPSKKQTTRELKIEVGRKKIANTCLLWFTHKAAFPDLQVDIRQFITTDKPF